MTPYDLYKEANKLNEMIRGGQLSNESLQRVGVSQDQIGKIQTPGPIRDNAIKDINQTVRQNTRPATPKPISAPSGFNSSTIHKVESNMNVRKAIRAGVPKALGGAAIGLGVLSGAIKAVKGLGKSAPGALHSAPKPVTPMSMPKAVAIGAGVGVGGGMLAGGMMNDKSASLQEDQEMLTPYDLYMTAIKEAAIDPRTNTGEVRKATPEELSAAAKRVNSFRKAQKFDKAVKGTNNAVSNTGEAVVGAIRKGKNVVGTGVGVAGNVLNQANNVVNELGGVDNIKNTVNNVRNAVAPKKPPTFGQKAMGMLKTHGPGVGVGAAVGAGIGLGGIALSKALSGPSNPQY